MKNTVVMQVYESDKNIMMGKCKNELIKRFPEFNDNYITHKFMFKKLIQHWNGEL